MTVLDLLLVNSGGLTTLATELYSTSTTIDDSDIRSTTICSVVSTFLNSIEVPYNLAMVRDTITYVESLSVEELASAEQLLCEKELEFETLNENIGPVEDVRVYIKEMKQQ